MRAQEDLEGMEMTEEDTENKRAEEGQRSTESSPRHEEAVMGHRVGERYWESGMRNWALGSAEMDCNNQKFEVEGEEPGDMKRAQKQLVRPKSEPSK